ncbi:MAG: chemotaxis protein CheD [Rhodocyclaceae bacterium]|nr:chemotaxis protein CheD [Rhodocyclaceae bacterium]
MNAVYLEPGDFQFGAAPLRLTTLLGSCVAITLWHPHRHVGGMCHIQLPGRSRPGGDGALDGRYAEDAFALFDRELQRHGSAAHEYVAKLFGAGNMFPASYASTISVGARNLAAARRELARRGLRPAAEHVGGAGHRKLIFDLASGDVWLAFSNLESAKETAIG